MVLPDRSSEGEDNLRTWIEMPNSRGGGRGHLMHCGRLIHGVPQGVLGNSLSRPMNETILLRRSAALAM